MSDVMHTGVHTLLWDALMGPEPEATIKGGVPWKWTRDDGPQVAPLYHAARQFAKVCTTGEGNEFGAMYTKSTDTVYMPPSRVFATYDEYASVFLHELAHWTGPRIGRSLTFAWKTPRFAREEVVAEVTSRMMLDHFGLSRARWTDDYIGFMIRRALDGLPLNHTFAYIELHVELATDCLKKQFATVENCYVDGTAASQPA